MSGTIKVAQTALAASVQSLLSPAGGIMAFGLGVASFVVPSLNKGLGVQLGVALIIGGLGVFHVTINKPAA
jgi:hypothetical protein